MSTYARNAIVLGLLVAVGPFAIDMYIPALPAIAADLGATTAATQATLMSYFVGFGVFQLVFGPVSDAVGRKAPLYVGLTLFAAASLGCAVTHSVEWLIALRVLQGIGASAAMVIPRAVIRDMYTGIEATRLMSFVMLVFSVSPILAPLFGSALIEAFGWHSVFVAVAVAAGLAFVLIATLLPETRPAGERVPVNAANLVAGFARLLGDARFIGLTFIGGFGLSGFFVFLATSSFLYMGHFGLTPFEYSLAFSVNAIGFIGTSQFAAWLGGRFGIARVVMVAVSVCAGFALLLLAVTAAGSDSLAVLMAILFVSNAALGLVIPATMVLALEEHGPIAGTASALGGTLHMVTGAIAIVLVSQVFDGTALPMVAAIALCATGAFAVSLVTLRSRRGS
ncbi:MAG: multidrug effflux MFS transporter [Alphaproteobacteria bacterium]